MNSGKRTTIILVVILIVVVAGAAIAMQVVQTQTSNGAQFAPQSASQESSSAQGNTDSSSSDSSESPLLPSNFTVTAEDGSKVSASDIIGKPALIGFWATWCPGCVQEAPEVQKVYEKYGDQVQFMMVDLADGQRETKQKALDFMKTNNLTYPVYFDESGMASNILQVRYLPTLYVFNADGEVVDGHVGASNAAQIEELVKKVVS